MIKNIKFSAIFALLMLGASTSALATFVNIDVTWSGASFGNGASATGFFTFDDAFFPEVLSENPYSLPNEAVTAASLSVVGTAGGVGDGIWGIADFIGFVFFTPAPLDLGTELIGQSIGGGLFFGGDPLSSTGDFNLFGAGGSVPYGVNYFTLVTVSGEMLRVTSMSPSAVPVPAAAWLFGSGLIGLIGVARRKAHV